MYAGSRSLSVLLAGLFLFSCFTLAFAEDGSTGAIRGTVTDAHGAPLPGAQVTVTNPSTGLMREATTDSSGRFAVDLISPGDYSVVVRAGKLAPLERKEIHLEIGSSLELTFQLSELRESVSVAGETGMVETQSAAVSNVIEQRAVTDLPLNGRRFTDLALLTPGVTADPRSLTSSSIGDLAFGGIRGFQSSFLVDGADFNNAFFSQARGRYRAPYQFSNEVIQEFRVSSNTYGAELGRSGGAVINVVTRSGANQMHGSIFGFFRDSAFAARNPALSFKPREDQKQFGFTVGGPIRKNRIFFYAGFDQHILHVPVVVEFVSGRSTLTPAPADYEASDQAVVFASAAQLSTLGGQYHADLIGNAGFLKLDATLTPHQHLSARLSTSRFYGSNNVFFDPASPVTTFALSSNGEEQVQTESFVVNLTSTLTARLTSHARAQYSRDVQESSANSPRAFTRINRVLNGMDRSSILPRQTHERRLHLAETLSYSGRIQTWKFGGDVLFSWIRNYFPSLFGGEYIFDNIRVNPFTFQPQTFGLAITPLRAYAHQVPNFYVQNFGTALSHPDSTDYAWFVEDSIRVTPHLALNLGLRYDLQTFNSDHLVTNPLWPDSGKVPTDSNNFAPRVGFAYSIGEHKPVVIRGGYGLFYARVPQIYNSAVEADNGLAQTHLFLDNANFFQRQVFPAYPNPLVSCPPGATTCTAPASLNGFLTTEISSFSHDFKTPAIQQASLTVEKELVDGFALGVSYLYVHGQHLLRARDVNLPRPTVLTYPVFDDTGTNFLGTFYSVDSFATWQFSPSITCPFPPCINPLARPIARVGSINVFESAASSVYNGLTVSARHRFRRGLFFRLAYTWAHAMDDAQDALVAGRPATVQNSYSTRSERGASVTDQRNRLSVSWIYEHNFFHRDQRALRAIFNDWKISGIVTFGSGRPFNAQVIGDANRDLNSENDRLPGVRRNSFHGPDYATTDLRLARTVHIRDRMRVELLAESFNILNRDNRRMDISDDGFNNAAASFVNLNKTLGTAHYPAHFRTISGFLTPTNAYAARQVQFGMRFIF